MWTCRRCDYQNPDSVQKCQDCLNPRPSSTSKTSLALDTSGGHMYRFARGITWPHQDRFDRLQRACQQDFDVTVYDPEKRTMQVRGSAGLYQVTLSSCTCPDFQPYQDPCKHIFALALRLRQDFYQAFPSPPAQPYMFSAAFVNSLFLQLTDEEYSLFFKLLSATLERHGLFHAAHYPNPQLDSLIAKGILLPIKDPACLFRSYRRNDLRNRLKSMSIAGYNGSASHENLVKWCVENVAHQVDSIIPNTMSVMFVPFFARHADQFFQHIDIRNRPPEQPSRESTPVPRFQSSIPSPLAARITTPQPTTNQAETRKTFGCAFFFIFTFLGIAALFLSIFFDTMPFIPPGLFSKCVYVFGALATLCIIIYFAPGKRHEDD